MAELLIEQAIFSNRGSGGYRFQARSPGFRDDWLPEAERLCAGFGERPPGVSCPSCVFAQPFGKQHVAVVQAADQGLDDAARPGALGFRLLVLPRPAYTQWIGDPFRVADDFAPPWQAIGELPALAWTVEPPPHRTVAQVQDVLKRVVKHPDHGEVSQAPVLLGTVQALVDGGRAVFQRPQPDAELVRGLWMLLPDSTRAHIWPASFAFGNALRFDVLVVPRLDGPDYPRYLHEDQAPDYPEGRYELGLQIAAEAGDQQELDALFARRSSTQTLRLALVLVAVVAVAAILMNALTTRPPPPPTTPNGAAPALNLRPESDYPKRLDPELRKELTRVLHELAEQVGVQPMPEPATAETLLLAIDRRLGTPSPRRDPGPLAELGPIERQVRALLWKHEVPGHDDDRRSVVELVDRLRQKLMQRK